MPWIEGLPPEEASVILKIIFGEVEDSVCHSPIYFGNRYEDEWITDPLTVAMIQDIDKAEVVGMHLIESPMPGADFGERDFRWRQDIDFLWHLTKAVRF